MILAVSGAALAARNPNPCADQPAGETTFVNDYAACEAYFVCFGTRAGPTIPCEDGQSFNLALQKCEAGGACLECPTDVPRLAVILALIFTNFCFILIDFY